MGKIKFKVLCFEKKKVYLNMRSRSTFGPSSSCYATVITSASLRRLSVLIYRNPKNTSISRKMPFYFRFQSHLVKWIIKHRILLFFVHSQPLFIPDCSWAQCLYLLTTSIVFKFSEGITSGKKCGSLYLMNKNINNKIKRCWDPYKIFIWVTTLWKFLFKIKIPLCVFRVFF